MGATAGEATRPAIVIDANQGILAAPRMLQEMRRSGLTMLVVGLPLMVAGIFLFVLLRDWAVAAFATVVLGRVYVP